MARNMLCDKGMAFKKHGCVDHQSSSDDPCRPERDETAAVRVFPWWFGFMSSGLCVLE